MATERIKMILEIHLASTLPLYKVLDSITDEQLNWKPASESRSIKEITLHLIRVDNYFLKRLRREIEVKVNNNLSFPELLNELKKIHQQIVKTVSNCKNDAELFNQSAIADSTNSDTINNHILHSCQHNLYHLSQMIYLRRALDRQWESPVKEWDKATRIIADYLAPKRD